MPSASVKGRLSSLTPYSEILSSLVSMVCVPALPWLKQPRSPALLFAESQRVFRNLILFFQKLY